MERAQSAGHLLQVGGSAADLRAEPGVPAWLEAALGFRREAEELWREAGLSGSEAWGAVARMYGPAGAQARLWAERQYIAALGTEPGRICVTPMPLRDHLL